MLLKLGVAVVAVLLLRIFWPSLVRGVRRTLLAAGIAGILFGAAVWLTSN